MSRTFATGPDSSNRPNGSVCWSRGRPEHWLNLLRGWKGRSINLVKASARSRVTTTSMLPAFRLRPTEFQLHLAYTGEAPRGVEPLTRFGSPEQHPFSAARPCPAQSRIKDCRPGTFPPPLRQSVHRLDPRQKATRKIGTGWDLLKPNEASRDGFPPRGKSKKSRKSALLHLGANPPFKHPQLPTNRQSPSYSSEVLQLPGHEKSKSCKNLGLGRARPPHSNCGGGSHCGSQGPTNRRR
jgi:hypothetical protein